MRKREYLTPDRAAELLGWVGSERGPRLIRVMRAKERLRGKEIMIRLGGKKNGIRYKFTEPMLHRYCPELFITTQDELVSDVRRHLSAIDGRMQAIVDERTAPEFEQLRAADKALARDLSRLAKHTDAMEQRLQTLESPRESAKVRT